MEHLREVVFQDDFFEDGDHEKAWTVHTKGLEFRAFFVFERYSCSDDVPAVD